jgi:taurine dioxygenase
MGSILHMKIIPPIGGDTLFAGMYAAYDALSPRLQNFLEGLTATHDGARAFAKYDTTKTDKIYPVAAHPVIARHPVSGRKVLFVNSGFTSHINELTRAESDMLLAYLYDHLSQPDFQVRFRWRENSVAFWDNRCTQHKAIWDYYPNVRSGFRVQIQGAVPPIPAAA